MMHECFKCRSKSRAQCVNLNYVPIKLFEIRHSENKYVMQLKLSENEIKAVVQ